MRQPEPARARDVLPAVFSRHAGAYRDRLLGVVGRGEARGRDRVLELLRPLPGQRVADLGCGPGVLTLPLAGAVGGGGLVLGADLAEGMLTLLREAAPPQVAPARMDMEALGVLGGALDAVACGHSLQFCPDLDLALSEIRRALRPGGRFAASVPGDDRPGGPHDVLDLVLQRRLPAAPELADTRATRAAVADADRLAAAVARAGFRDVVAERIEEATTFDDAADLVRRSLDWWACAWRLEAVPERERAAVRAEAIEALRARFGEGALRVAGATTVVSAVR